LETQPDFINGLQGQSPHTKLSPSPTLQTNQLHAEIECFVSTNHLTSVTANSYRFTVFSYPKIQILVSFAEHKLQGRDLSRLTVFLFLGLCL